MYFEFFSNFPIHKVTLIFLPITPNSKYYKRFKRFVYDDKVKLFQIHEN